MKIRLLCLFSSTMIVAAASSSLQFVPLPNVNARDMLPLPNGNVVVFGVITASGCTVVSPGSCDQTEFPLLSVIDASGTQKAILPRSALGSGNSSLAAASIDASGNIWITGQTDSDDFPLVHPLFFQKADYHAVGFTAKLDANLNILFSTFLGGQPALGPSNPTNIGLDSSGNAYVVGNTEDTAFPTTGSGFGVGAPSSNPLNPQTYTFVLKISSDGSRLLYSRLLGGNGSPCTGGSACIGYAVYTIPSAIVVNANGSLTVAGATNATNFPITANAYQTVGGAFITRISADGAQLIWSTEVGIATQFLGLRFFSSVQSIALDAADDVYVAGSSGGSIATTPNALQSTVALSVYPAVLNGFAIELSSDATQLLYATNLGGTNGASLTGLTLDPAGNVWIAGNTRSSDFPGLSNATSSGLDFALELNAKATALQQIFTFVPATVTAPPAFDSNGNLLLLGSAGNLLRLNTSTRSSTPGVFAITNAAVARATAGVGPGEIVTIYGVGLGPSKGIAASPDMNGIYPTQLGGVTATFDDILAPLLYVGPYQINLQVPFSLTYPTTLAITTPNASLPSLQLQLIGSIGIFDVLNQDGSLNSASNPAIAGSVVSLYLTGLGDPSFAATDGAISSSANSAFQNSIEVGWSGSLYPLPLSYAGTAPGQINGLDQVNVQLPAGAQNPTLTITRLSPFNGSAPATSNPVLVYAQ